MCNICRGTRDGDPTIAAIRRGRHVCTAAAPLIYPGVVNMASQHPPMKPNTGTTGLGCRPKVRVTGRDTIAEILRLPPRKRPGCSLYGVGLSGAYPFVSSVGARPLLEAILYRVFKDLPTRMRPSISAFNKLALNAGYLLPEFNEPLQRMRLWEWFKSYTNSRRRHALIRAHAERLKRGSNHKDYDKISAFVKTEKLPWFGVPKDMEPPTTFVEDAVYIARLVQAPHDETHLDAGRYMKPLTKRLKEVWNSDFWIFYASVNPEILDKWLEKISTCRSFFFADYSAFDATHSIESWALVEGLYEQVFPRADHPDLWRAIDVWRKPKGKCRLRKDGVTISYDAPVCNASGRDDTALVNALLNGLCLASAFAAELSGVELEQLEPHHYEKASRMCKISVVGDDSVVGCNFDIGKIDVVRHLKRFGLIVKSETAQDIANVTYLGSMPYRVGNSWRWGPTLGRRLYKAFWKESSDGHPIAWLRGVAQQLALNQHVPVLRELSEKILDLTKGPTTKVQVDENRLWTVRTSATERWSDETLVHLAKRYDVPVSMILADLEIIKKIDRVPCVAYLPFVCHCVAIDDC